MKLTARDYYKANDPEYLERYPEVKAELVKQQKKCRPAVCEQCYFFKAMFNDDLTLQGAVCAYDRHEVEWGKLSPDCQVLGGKNV